MGADTEKCLKTAKLALAAIEVTGLQMVVVNSTLGTETESQAVSVPYFSRRVMQKSLPMCVGENPIHIATFRTENSFKKGDAVQLNLYYDRLETKNPPILPPLGKWGTGMISAY